MINWFKTNKQLRQQLVESERLYKQEQETRRSTDRKLVALGQEIYALKKERDSALASYTRLLAPTKPRQALTSMPRKTLHGPAKGSKTAPTPPSSLSNVDGLPERYSSSVRPEPSHDVGSFLVGMAVGAAVDSLFSSSSDSSSSSSDNFSSGGGGDYSGGGASGDF